MENYRAVFRNADFSTVRIVGKKTCTKDLYDIIAAKVNELEITFVASNEKNGLQKFMQLNSNEISLLRQSRALEKIEKEIPNVVIKPRTENDGIELVVMCFALLIIQFKRLCQVNKSQYVA